MGTRPFLSERKTKEWSKKRVKNIPTAMPLGTAGALGSSNTDVSVGGATVFIIDVEKFYCY